MTEEEKEHLMQYYAEVQATHSSNIVAFMKEREELHAKHPECEAVVYQEGAVFQLFVSYEEAVQVVRDDDTLFLGILGTRL